MKKLLLILSLCLLSFIAKAALPIDYTQIFTSTTLGTDPTLEKSGSPSAADGWYVGTTTGASSPTVEASSLSYSNYVDNNAGKAILLPSTVTAARNSVFGLTTSTATYIDGTFYLSALIYVTAAPASAVAMLSMDRGYTGNSQRAKIYIKAATGGFVLGGAVASSTGITYSTVLSYNTTHLVVIKFTNTSTVSATDYSYLYVNPTIGDTEANNSAKLINTNSATVVSGSLEYIRGISVIQNAGVGAKIAGIRFSNNWADATKAGSASVLAVNPPSAVGAATAVTPTGFTANWTLPASNNASKYSVLLYQGSNLISTTSTLNNSANSLTIPATLTPGLSYSYQVVAKGDGSTTSDASPVISTSSFTSPVPSVMQAAVTTTGFLATWIPTTNSTTYTINVYQGGELLNSSVVSGQASAAAPITGLSAGLNYSFSVTTSEGYTGSSATFTAIDPLLKENFQDWAEQIAAGPYSKNKTLVDGITTGTFSGSSLIVAPTVSIATAGAAIGNGYPSNGRVQIAGTSSDLTLPLLSSVGQVTVRSNVGTDLSGFRIQTYNSGTSTWNDVANTSTQGVKLVIKTFSYNLSYATPTQIRFLANQSGSVSLWDVQVNPYIPTAPSKLASPTVGSASLPVSDGYTASWSKVPNALGYYVLSYSGSTLMKTSYADGQATESLAVSGLLSSTTYTYKVIARGDGVSSYSSSDPSNASTEVTTGAPAIVQLTAPTVGVATDIASGGFTANWTAVDHAVSYTVKIYWGTSLVDSTNVSGQTASFVAVSNLVPGLTYTYTVIARGNGSAYTDSNPSSASSGFPLLAAAIPTNNKLKIILKLDDLGVLNSVFAASPVWDYLSTNKIKWGGGAIANRFDGTSAGVLSGYLNALNNVGDTLVEVWNHGYDHSGNSSTGIYEFSNSTYADQKSHFDQATQTIKSILGIQMHSFGTPYNQSDVVTNTVIGEDSNYKVFLFASQTSASNGVSYLNNRVNMENGTGNPVYNYFVSNYIASKATYKDYMILQGHPNYYTLGSSTLDQFKLIVQYLISEGVEFVRPYDYYRYLSLNAPTNLVSGTVASNQISVSWNDNSGTENGFRIERSTDQTNWSLAGNAPQNSTTFTDTNVPGQGTYYYRVYANCGINSDYSNILQVSNIGTSSINLADRSTFSVLISQSKSCIISGEIFNEGLCSVELRNVSGQQVKNIFYGHLNSGKFSFETEISDLAPGVYFCVFNSFPGNGIQKMIIK